MTDTWIDKSSWGDGPWQYEPDRVEWIDETTAYPCLMIRHEHFGHWRGYVAVPPGHAYHGVDDDDAPPALHEAAHGEVTYAGPSQRLSREPRQNIDHQMARDELGDLWWFGFDCMHGNDYVPSLPGMRSGDYVPGLSELGWHYRDVSYVRERCAEMALVLKGAGR